MDIQRLHSLFLSTKMSFFLLKADRKKWRKRELWISPPAAVGTLHQRCCCLFSFFFTLHSSRSPFALWYSTHEESCSCWKNVTRYTHHMHIHTYTSVPTKRSRTIDEAYDTFDAETNACQTFNIGVTKPSCHQSDLKRSSVSTYTRIDEIDAVWDSISLSVCICLLQCAFCNWRKKPREQKINCCLSKIQRRQTQRKDLNEKQEKNFFFENNKTV